MKINETVLEMHFHHAILELFRNTLGLGNGAFNFYKYSPQRECFVGFDQAFVKTDLSPDQLFQELKNSAINNGYNLSNFFVGLFLQYKVVKEMVKRSRVTPPQITANPHYRISLDTKKNIRTGVSQHELLFKLNRNIGAFVYYACPFVFDRSDLYSRNVDLSKLRLADLSSCPSIYSDNDSHFVYYSDETDPPIWCSEPVEGEALSPEKMVNNIAEHITREGTLENQLSLLDELDSPFTIKEVKGPEKEMRLYELVYESLTILRYSDNKTEKGDGV